jgi:hypothetical protein
MSVDRSVSTIRVLSLTIAVASVLAVAGCGAPQGSEGPVASRQQAPLDLGPRRIHRMNGAGRAAVASAPSGAHLDYFGGRVVSNLEVVQVIWGSGSFLPEVTSTTSPSMATFYEGALNSPYVDWLTEYDTTGLSAPASGQVIGRGSFRVQVVITPSAANDGAVIDDANIQAELALQIQSGALPPPTHDAAGNNNTSYAIFFPHGKQITLQGNTSCVQFCAYHGTIGDAGGMGEIYYSVQPDFQAGSGCELGCGAAPTAFGNYTQVASHEMVETMTDPEVALATTFAAPLAWFDRTFGEIGDICNDQHGTVVGGDGVTYDVQTEFSDGAGDCVVTRSPTVSASATSFEGGTPVTGTLSLLAVAAAGGVRVALASSVPALVTVPASVTIPAGSATAAFPVTSVQATVQTSVTLTATFPGGTASVNLVVLASPTVSSLALAPAAVVGGATSTATVMLTGPAPAGGAQVALTSSLPGVAMVPANVLVPAGASGATFTVTTTAQTAMMTATISASFHRTTKTATLVVAGVVVLSSLVVAPAALDAGHSATATLTLTDLAPAGGAVVVLASSNATVAPVPGSVTIAAGSKTGTFAINTNPVTAPTTVTISGTFPAGDTQSATLTVNPAGNAVFDATLKVPRCPAVGSFCDTGGSLIVGRDNLVNGPEPDQPNTLGGSCADGTAGSFHSSESLDRLRIATVDGTALAPGKLVEVDATVFSFSSDALDIFIAPDAGNPAWTLVSTVTTPLTHQETTLSVQFTLPSALALPVIRADWRFNGSPAPCATGPFDDHDDLVFAVSGAPPVNQPPTVNAGPDQTVTLPAFANLAGTATDDGLPNPPATLTLLWSVVSGPGTVTFGNATAASTTATFSAAGSYVLRLTASDSALMASDDVAVTVNPAPPVNHPPVVNAGPDQTITLPAAASLSGTATDDGLPNPPGVVTTTWSKASGPGTVTFANASARTTTAAFSTSGTYVLLLTASDSALSSSDTVQITVLPVGSGSPCANLCNNPRNFSINGSFQSGALGTGAVCDQTTSVLHGGNCGNFVSPRTLRVNGTIEPCTGRNWSSVPPARNGGYCIQVTPGQRPFAFFTAF